MPNDPSVAPSPADKFLREIWKSLGGDPALLQFVDLAGQGDLPSAFAVSDLAAASVAAAGLAAAELMSVGGLAAAELTSVGGGGVPSVRVERRLASFWFGTTFHPAGWSAPPPWDAIAGDYATADGWIRLHTNAPHHWKAALAVLRTPAEKDAVAAAVSRWSKDDLEAAVVQNGGCAAAMRGLADWAAHPQGKAVLAEPLLWIEDGSAWSGNIGVARNRPLSGIRILDLTRVLAGPVATRFLAGLGADVLRIDPPEWDEPGVIPEVTLGKRCARLDLRRPADRSALEELLASADVLVHGYRPGALDGLGLGEAERQRLRPGLVDVSLDAYGWSGPWRGRRGFDSLVQMSSGIAAEGMRRFGADKPRPLPVQALDQATGYLMAAAALRGLTRRLTRGVGSITRASLARTAALLIGTEAPARTGPFAEVNDADFEERIEATSWGPARRTRPPLRIEGAAMRWDRPASPLGSSEPAWMSLATV